MPVAPGPGLYLFYMKVKYFSETDTAFIEFGSTAVFETKEVNENIFLDLDKDGNLVGMTIEHAKKQADISEFSLQQIVEKVT
jgi:uncharacterized protein YuzE